MSRGPSKSAIRRALGAVAFAYAAALILAAIDTFIVVEPETVQLHCLGVGAAAWAIPGAAVALSALLVRAIVTRVPRLSRFLFPDEERLAWQLAAVMLAAVGVWAIDHAVGLVGQRSLVTQRFMAALAGFATLGGAALIYPSVARLLGRGLARLPAFFRRPGMFLGIATLVGLVAFWNARRIEPAYLEEIGWEMPAALLVAFVAALVGTVVGKRAVYGAAFFAGLTIGIIVWHHTTPTPTTATSAVNLRGAITPALMALTARPIRRGGRHGAPAVVTACRPDDRVVQPEELGAAPESAPDIVLITVDGWRWDHTSMAKGATEDLTPRLQAHARRAVVFERAYTPAPSTRQSFRALFTGLIPGRAGAPETPGLRWALSVVEGQPTLAAYLSAAGYETIALVGNKRAFPEAHGGLYGFDDIDDRFDEYQFTYHYSASYKISNIIGRLAVPPRPGTPPRFIWTHLIEPHFPFSTGPELPSSTRLPYHGRHEHSIRYIDQQLNRLLAFLAGRERKNDTWVFITADHGEAFGEHGVRRHGATVYEEEIHVPLLIWGPRTRPGRRTVPVSTLDLVSTILDSAGLEVPGSVCGRSLMPALMADEEPEATPVYAAALPDDTTDFFEVAWIDGDRKLILDGGTGEMELYDLATDGGEETNLLEEDPEAAADLVAGLIRYYRERGMNPADYSLGD